MLSARSRTFILLSNGDRDVKIGVKSWRSQTFATSPANGRARRARHLSEACKIMLVWYLVEREKNGFLVMLW